MRGKIAWWLLAILLALVTSAEASMGWHVGLLQSDATAQLTVERSRVSWQSPDMAQPDQVDSAGRPVQAADRISTDGLGRARLSLATDAFVTIYHDTELTLLDAPSRYLQLDEGTLMVQVSEQGMPVVVETAEGRVEAIGSVLISRLVDHRHNSSSTWVLVQSGEARVDGGGSQVAVAPKQQTWMENNGQPEKPLEARRDLVGNQFYLIDDLTNGAVMDEDLLASAPAAQTSAFPLWLVLTLGAVVMVGGLILAAMRSRPRTAIPSYPGPQAAPEAGFAPASLLFDGDGGRQVAIPGGLSIGRAPDNQLPVGDPMVSSRHARIFIQGGEYIIEDLASRNGTFVNDQRVTAQRLQNGDRIRIGQLIFTFQQAVRPPLPSSAPPAPPGPPRAGVQLAQGQFVAIQGAVLAIGRAPDNQVILDDPQASGRHARLVMDPGGVVVEDLGSTNGTFVNGQQVNRQLLTHGDRIRVGQTELIFQAGLGQEGVV